MENMKVLGLYAVTALAEILGCYLPWLILQRQHSPWLWLPTLLSLAAFVYLLSLHPGPAARVYAAYGGVYVVMALLWLWQVDGVVPTRWDWIGGAITLLGMAIIAFQPRSSAN